MTVADINLFCDMLITGPLTQQPDITKQFPKLCALQERVGKHPKIAAWVAERPKTIF